MSEFPFGTFLFIVDFRNGFSCDVIARESDDGNMFGVNL